MLVPKPTKRALEVPLKTILAHNLAKFRREQGLSQEALCHLAGLHRSAVGHIERARRNITLETLEALASALHVSPNLLLKAPDDTELHVLPVPASTSQQPSLHVAKSES
ncbi:MAG: XRE family transcriptional regulator [Delftia acidovorans]|jgi:transcriptional regulator with XRE-family HTH domain|uniref:helix-turn-helix domain-containing protein n=1 Tax=Delftia acidovorans TaxID=80866 RepID=UPI0009B7B122|nr:helix-turn-helix transcriptional regulator [Delftia acidovorans]KAA9174126.1 helix-turn-helix transcriptional regulator [Delftia sp. BR1]PZP66111.1 MAG: XRE family transcriptional regulator [Delftia acidovorans]